MWRASTRPGGSDPPPDSPTAEAVLIATARAVHGLTAAARLADSKISDGQPIQLFTTSLTVGAGIWDLCDFC